MKRFIYIFLCLEMIMAVLPSASLGEFLPALAFEASRAAAPGAGEDQGEEPDVSEEPDGSIEPNASLEPNETQQPASPVIPGNLPIVEDSFTDVSTPHLLLMEANTGTVLYARSAYEKAYPASTTKIMTAILAIENLKDLNQVVTVGWRDVSGFGPTSSMMGLIDGEQIALIDVLYGMMMRSGNDAAKLLAIRTALDVHGDSLEISDAVEAFVSMMNDKAAELGMKSTHFATVDGRHDDEHYTTAYDFGILLKYALQNPMFCNIISTSTYDVEPNNKHSNGYHLENSNKLICKKEADKESFLYENCIGGKTGETNQAGYCLASAAEKDGVKLLLIQFGDNNSKIETTYRYEVAKQIYDWGFENYKSMKLSEFGVQTSFEVQSSGFSPFDEQLGRLNAHAELGNITIDGMAEYLNAIASNPECVRIDVDVSVVEAPILAGDVIGSVSYYFYSDKPIVVNLIADRDVAAASKYTPEPHETAFISNTPPPGSGKNCNLNIQRSPGSNEYSVWVYFDDSLYTMNSTEWHYLYCDENRVFRAAATADVAGGITLYQQMFDSNGIAYYRRCESISNGGVYLIASGSFVMSSKTSDGTLSAIEVSIGSDGIITSGVTDDMLFTFETESNGYRIKHNSRYLTRNAGSGVLFFILIAVLILVIIILIRLIIERSSGKYRRRRRRSHYRARRR
ncbi:MAG: D-alanyl-D-alanine carboxypeptidase [Christensenellaceae bacterium]|nr:D-alanyl-D-alanine carboxypeptidase [Christensenellaceae bacterium]